jgi:hypothetical protein
MIIQPGTYAILTPDLISVQEIRVIIEAVKAEPSRVRLVVMTDIPTFDVATERAQQNGWQINANDVTPVWEIISLTPEELAALARKVWDNSALFLQSFTLPEMAAISLSTDPTIAAMRLLLTAWAGEVWSDDPRIVLGFDALKSTGIISDARAAEILTK